MIEVDSLVCSIPDFNFNPTNASDVPPLPVQPSLCNEVRPNVGKLPLKPYSYSGDECEDCQCSNEVFVHVQGDADDYE